MTNEIITSEEAKRLSVEKISQQLSTSKDGLTEEEAKRRLESYGYNEILEKKESPIIKFLRNFWGPIPWMIEIAVILSASPVGMIECRQVYRLFFNRLRENLFL